MHGQGIQAVGLEFIQSSKSHFSAGKAKSQRNKSTKSRSELSHQHQDPGPLVHNSAFSANRHRRLSQAKWDSHNLPLSLDTTQDLLPYPTSLQIPRSPGRNTTANGQLWHQFKVALLRPNTSTFDYREKQVYCLGGWNQAKARARKPVLCPEIKTWP